MRPGDERDGGGRGDHGAPGRGGPAGDERRRELDRPVGVVDRRDGDPAGAANRASSAQSSMASPEIASAPQTRFCGVHFSVTRASWRWPGCDEPAVRHPVDELGRAEVVAVHDGVPSVVEALAEDEPERAV